MLLMSVSKRDYTLFIFPHKGLKNDRFSYDVLFWRRNVSKSCGKRGTLQSQRWRSLCRVVLSCKQCRSSALNNNTRSGWQMPRKHWRRTSPTTNQLRRLKSMKRLAEAPRVNSDETTEFDSVEDFKLSLYVMELCGSCILIVTSWWQQQKWSAFWCKHSSSRPSHILGEGNRLWEVICAKEQFSEWLGLR